MQKQKGLQLMPRESSERNGAARSIWSVREACRPAPEGRHVYSLFRFGTRIGTMNLVRAASPSPPLEERAGERRLFYVFCVPPGDVGQAKHHKYAPLPAPLPLLRRGERGPLGVVLSARFMESQRLFEE
jgi:hypothetical protein